MSFIFEDNATFTWPVTVSVPKDGDHVDFTITGRFAMLDDEEFFAVDPDIATAGAGIDAEIGKLMRVFKGWEPGDVQDASGRDLDATPENIRRFLGQRPARLGVAAAYSRAVSPTTGFRAKN